MAHIVRDGTRGTGRWHAAGALLLAIALHAPLSAQPAASSTSTTARETPVTAPTNDATAPTAHARGTFDVKLTPQPADDHADGATLGRLWIDKQFHGDLEATSKGQMLTGMSSVKGSAGYVAIERVTGTLAGRRGSFVLQHSGTMTRGAPTLVVGVVPDSGTEELAGLTGTMTIDTSGGGHAYAFAYALPPRP